MTAMQAVGIGVVTALVFAPAVLVWRIRASLDREERRRSSGSRGTQVQFRPAQVSLPRHRAPEVIDGDYVDDNETQVMPQIRPASWDETQVIPVQRGRGGVR